MTVSFTINIKENKILNRTKAMPLKKHPSFSHPDQLSTDASKRKLGRTLSSPNLKTDSQEDQPKAQQQQNGVSRKKSNTDSSLLLKSPRSQRMEHKTDRRLKLFNKLKK